MLLIATSNCRADNILSRMLRQVVPAKLRAYIEDDVDIDPLLDAAAASSHSTDGDEIDALVHHHNSNDNDAMLLQQAEESVLDAIDFYVDDDDDDQPEITPAAPAMTFVTGTTSTKTKKKAPPSMITTTTTTTNVWNDLDGGTEDGSNVGGSSTGDTSGWNPFTWFAPKLRSIPYNPDTDLQTVCTRQIYMNLPRFNDSLCTRRNSNCLKTSKKCHIKKKMSLSTLELSTLETQAN